MSKLSYNDSDVGKEDVETKAEASNFHEAAVISPESRMDMSAEQCRDQAGICQIPKAEVGEDAALPPKKNAVHVEESEGMTASYLPP